MSSSRRRISPSCAVTSSTAFLPGFFGIKRKRGRSVGHLTRAKRRTTGSSSSLT
ncbi:hypothetical protein EVA_14623 [gut metagenome]|uniref:Uncharacterized protein n=1 Tax=gut metagenome TaxID=749906 RepID=J9CBF3_9ZZZZ